MNDSTWFRNAHKIMGIILIYACILLSCTESPAEKPTLSDEKLAQIMADLNVAEAATIGLSGYPKDSLMKAYFAQVFEIHNTNLDEYEKNLRIVSTDMNHYQQILLASLKLLEQKGDSDSE